MDQCDTNRFRPFVLDQWRSIWIKNRVQSKVADFYSIQFDSAPEYQLRQLY